jgi:hypothetical protein
MMSSRVGGRIPYFNTGIVCFNRGYLRARAARNKHQDDTKANWTTVSVMGLGSAVRMALEDVLVEMEVMYHTPHSIYLCQISSICCTGNTPVHTMSLGDTGALSASAISWAFWLTLALRVRIVLIASERLFCLPCLPPVVYADPFE